ncbi:uncharacterized protein [Paramisgurnus dabryanus]|uniref:uncharacterized protein n=1 Tax=Paramisgurnus dabryanus TaxID=90735 RepID=UPI003CCF4F2D
MVAVLAQAAETVGLDWVNPPQPEPSRLDDWFFGASRVSQPSPPVPFFPEVHEELTRTWKSPVSTRLRPFQPSPLTSLTSGAAKGYTGIPPVERAVTMQLCPATAPSWKDRPTLPSRACRQSSGLMGAAHQACGEAASALHAMALLQVHQAKALRDLHEGGHDSPILSELRAATGLALRATKVTAQAIGRAMSTMVVQESHLWLCLADMSDAEKNKFLDAPVSQTGLLGESVESFAQQFSTAQIAQIMPRRKRPASRPPAPAAPAAPSFHHRESVRCTCIMCRGRSPAGEGRDRAGPSNQDEVGFLQPVFHSTKERRWVTTDLGFARFEKISSEEVFQNDNTKANIQFNSPPRLVCGNRPEIRVISCVHSPSSQTVSSVCIRGSGIPVQSFTVRAVSPSPCVQESSGGSVKAPQRERCSHIGLPRRLAYNSAFSADALRAQRFNASASRPFGSSGQLGKEQTLPNAEDLFPRYGTGLDRFIGAFDRRARPVNSDLPRFISREE